MEIGFIGAGQMARALATGIASQSAAENAGHSLEFWIHDPSPGACESFRKGIGSSAVVHELESNHAVVAKSKLVFVAVKPHYVSTALADIGSAIDPASTVIISVAAGVSIAAIVKLVEFPRVVRVMPNTPCLIGKGVAGVVASPEVGREQLDEIVRLLKSVGSVVEVAEEQLDAVTGLSGSGPAFVFTFLEALTEGGMLNGLPPDIALSLAVDTVSGAAELVRQSEDEIATLRDRVTSPGGTTLAGLAVLEEMRFSESVRSAVTAATQRSRELGSD